MKRMKRPTIGKCKHYPIPKAALIFYYEDKDAMDSIDYGDLYAIHTIVDIAGGKHCSMFTSAQVTSRLRSSPYWTHETIRGFYSGIGNGKASLFKPSEEGEEYYEKHLKNRVKEANKQPLTLSCQGSGQRPLNVCSTDVQPVKKRKEKESKEKRNHISLSSSKGVKNV